MVNKNEEIEEIIGFFGNEVAFLGNNQDIEVKESIQSPNKNQKLTTESFNRHLKMKEEEDYR